MRLLALLLLALALTACAGGRPASQAGDCAACHADEAQAFAQSRHSQAGQSAVFAALRARAGTSTALCDQCHRAEGSDAPGMTCLTCHAAVGNRGVGTGALAQDRDGAVLVGDERGLHAPHAVAQSGFLTSSDLCATCHVVHGPGAFVEDPLASWQHSPAGQRGVTCQGCHLSPDPGADVPRPLGRNGRPLADHRFVGLASDTLLAHALALDLAIEGGQAKLTVRATAQGHRVLAGAAFVRGLRAQVEPLDASGAALDAWPLRLDATPTPADPLTATGVLDRGLEPGEHTSGAWPLPQGAARLRACLAEEPVQAELAAFLGLPAAAPHLTGCVEIPAP